MCMESSDCKLRERVEKIDQRVTRLETRMSDGFNTVTAAVNQLAADFGSRMNTLDQRIVNEKAKWGDWARHALSETGKWLGKWGAIITAAAIGMGNIDKIAKLFAN